VMGLALHWGAAPSGGKGRGSTATVFFCVADTHEVFLSAGDGLIMA